MDDFLAPVRGDIDIDIRRAIALGSEKTLEQQSVKDRINRRDTEAVAHGGIRGRASPLAQNPVCAAKLDDVVDDKKIAGKAELSDDAKLMIDLFPRSLEARVRPRPVARLAETFGEGPKPAFLAVALGGGRRRKVRSDEGEIEREARREMRGGRDRARVARHELCKLRSASEMGQT